MLHPQPEKAHRRGRTGDDFEPRDRDRRIFRGLRVKQTYRESRVLLRVQPRCGGRGQIVGAILGAVAGGIAGSAIEENTTKKNALEITVRLDGGQLIAVVQEMGSERFQPGDRVRVLSGNGSSRVTR